MRRFVHLVWNRGSRCSEFLRRQDEEVHGRHEDQHVLHGSLPHRLRSGENLWTGCCKCFKLAAALRCGSTASLFGSNENAAI